MKVKAALQTKSNRPLTVCEVDLEEPRPNEVLVKITACGSCHTDVMMQHGSSQYPFLLGHEGSGIIEKVGKNVSDFTSGESVVISYTSCGHCPACRKKQPYHCESIYDPFSLATGRTGQQVFSIREYLPRP